jgi:hypothetical protein
MISFCLFTSSINCSFFMRKSYLCSQCFHFSLQILNFVLIHFVARKSRLWLRLLHFYAAGARLSLRSFLLVCRTRALKICMLSAILDRRRPEKERWVFRLMRRNFGRVLGNGTINKQYIQEDLYSRR